MYIWIRFSWLWFGSVEFGINGWGANSLCIQLCRFGCPINAFVHTNIIDSWVFCFMISQSHRMAKYFRFRLNFSIKVPNTESLQINLASKEWWFGVCLNVRNRILSNHKFHSFNWLLKKLFRSKWNKNI